jgi:hypothetical protein
MTKTATIAVFVLTCVAVLAASPAAAEYISLWDSGVSNGPGSPNNPSSDVVAGAVVVCPPGTTISADHLWCVSQRRGGRAAGH